MPQSAPGLWPLCCSGEGRRRARAPFLLGVGDELHLQGQRVL